MTRTRWRIIFYANAVLAITNAMLLARPGYQWLNVFAALLGLCGVWFTWRYT